jgi:CPA1 family monovalent cation:H+ antiporter
LVRLDAVVALLFVIIPLVALARRLSVAYPIVLVLSGLVLGFIPGLPAIPLQPNIVLLVFLPPLLYWEALSAPLVAIRQNARTVGALVIGLVVATAAAVGVVAHALIPNLPWAAAFALGAIVSPTDAVAFAPIAARISMPPRIIAIIEAEGLLNDATALILYTSAVAAMVSGVYRFSSIVLAFIESSIFAVALGVAVGALIAAVWKRVRDPDLQAATALIAPYVAYLPAHYFNISAVLSVVSASLFLNRYAVSAMTPDARQRSNNIGKTISFLMNAIIFLLVGLQLHPALVTLSVYSREHIFAYALAIAATVILIRFAWIFGMGLIPRRRPRDFIPSDEWKLRVIGSWAGFRGGISLAAALALPIAVASGAAFPRRQLMIFLVFGVIFVTLVGQGLTFPWLLRLLRLGDDNREAREMRYALAQMSSVALMRLARFESDHHLNAETLDVLKRRYSLRAQRYSLDALPDVLSEARIYHDASRELLEAQRAKLDEMQRQGRIDGNVRTRIQTMLDLEELQLERLLILEQSGAAAAEAVTR